ncbi:ArfGap-domain-containing protein [Stereum hirsutum FP-91666 SS1]|uniref:ArfGap-domain-containing protein n=1 Tax=Stereum hirsutum (strain FP-91666) TaxID=721885 RepID=UPI00044495F2|nr:ArfGap-domain-containing protein [Stereum hirsutum FP-91666 SS1]EIM85729.1 ArfGap-domain-containing protein [Stereum hirsutum FP-91666 SS1]
MSDQASAKKILQELIKRDDLKNKVCVDCTNPNPQWASLSFAVFLCLQCAGVHRGFGVHISFVRSVSMDSWTDTQIKRMQSGGNKPFLDFIRAYDPAQGGYTEGMPKHDQYHCWAATQYREKLDAELQDKPWSASAPPPSLPTNNNSSTSPTPSRPSSAQGQGGLRKSRASAGPNRSYTSPSFSPASASGSGSPNANSGSPYDQKSANENYFASLGSMNASRPDDLPPSLGGRYQGFGSTPTPSSPSLDASNPSYGMSSRAAPTLSDLQENPIAALSKGWSIFSSAVASSAKVVNESLIQPGVERVTDPEFREGVKGYVSEAGKRAGEGVRVANGWGVERFGVDVAGGVGGVIGKISSGAGVGGGMGVGVGGASRSGYAGVGGQGQRWGEEETSALYQDEDEDAFFSEYAHAGMKPGQGQTTYSSSSASAGVGGSGSGGGAQTNTATTGKKADGWDDDEWKDF